MFLIIRLKSAIQQDEVYASYPDDTFINLISRITALGSRNEVDLEWMN